MPKSKPPEPRNKVEIYPLEVGQLRTNCYLLEDTLSKKILIIDPGDDEEYVKNVITDKNLLPSAIIATHGHFDHAMAVSDLKLDFQTPFYLNKKDNFLIKNINKNASYYLKRAVKVIIPKIDVDLENKLNLKIEDLNIKVIKTPGHTPGSVCLYFKKEGILFCGDLLFAGGLVGRSDFSYGDGVKLKQSVNKILELPKKTLVYPGHGEPFLLQDFKFVP